MLSSGLVLSSVCVACAYLTPLTPEQTACLRLAQSAGLSFQDLDASGRSNLNQGKNNLIYGKGNHIQGSNNCVVGFGNHVQGDSNALVGGMSGKRETD
jgi:hypothetical protein